jgi:hypothetical protein
MTIWLRAKAPGSDLVANPLVHGGTHGLVEVALAAFELDAAHHDGLGRQLGGHLLLAPSQDEGGDAAGQQIPAHGITVLLDWRAPAGGEILLVTEEARQQEVELAPQLAQVVLQGRTGEAQAVLRLEGAHHLGGLAGGILDGLGFVEDQGVVFVGGQLLPVAPQEWVSGEADVVRRDLREGLGAARTPQAEHLEIGGEALGLPLPVEHQGGGQHHQGRLAQAPAALLGEQVGEGLGGLAEAHVVGQDATQLVLAQVLEPGQTVELVGAQIKGKALGCCHRLDLPDTTDALDPVIEACQAFGTPAVAKHVRQARGVESGHLEGAGRGVEEVHQIAGDGLDPLGGQGHTITILKLHHHLGAIRNAVDLLGIKPARILAEDGVEHGRQIDPTPIHLDTQGHFEPAFVAFIDPNLPATGHQHPVAEVLGAIDVPAGGTQLGGDQGEEVNPVGFTFETVETFRNGTGTDQPATLEGLEADAQEGLPGGLLGGEVTLHADGTAIGQTGQLAGGTGFETGVAIGKRGGGHVVLMATEISLVAPVLAPAPAEKGGQTEDRTAGE